MEVQFHQFSIQIVIDADTRLTYLFHSLLHERFAKVIKVDVALLCYIKKKIILMRKKKIVIQVLNAFIHDS